MFFPCNKKKKTLFQVTLEHVAVITVVIGALLWMKAWIQKGIQGKIKRSTDDIGAQFDPENTDAIHFSVSFSVTREEADQITTQTNSHDAEKMFTSAPKK